MLRTRSLPITAFIPLATACSGILRCQKQHHRAMKSLLTQRGLLAPRALLEERKELLERLAEAEAQIRELGDQENARLLEGQLHRRQLAAFRWRHLAGRALIQKERQLHRIVTTRLKARSNSLQQRLLRFAKAVRMRSKAGGARALTHQQLQLLSPRATSPVVSDGGGQTDPPPKREPRERLPGGLGELTANRAGTPREVGGALVRAVADSLRPVSFAGVAQSPRGGEPEPGAGAAFSPHAMGGTADGSPVASAAEWSALFDGGGTDQGFEGAQVLPPGPSDRERGPSPSRPEADDGCVAAIPFVSPRPPTVAARRGARYRRSLQTVEELAGLHGGSGGPPRPPAAPEASASEVLDSAREMEGSGCPGKAEARPGTVPALDLGAVSRGDRPEATHPELRDGPGPGGPDDAGGGSPRAYPRQRAATADACPGSQAGRYDADAVPRSALLELKLKHSLQVRAMQRTFEERLHIVNSYWMEQGVHLVDRKTSAAVATSPAGGGGPQRPGPGALSRGRAGASSRALGGAARAAGDGKASSTPPVLEKQAQTGGQRPTAPEDGASAPEALLPSYHAFIYPSQRSSVSYAEGMQALKTLRARSHDSSSGVRPFPRQPKPL